MDLPAGSFAGLDRGGMEKAPVVIAAINAHLAG